LARANWRSHGGPSIHPRPKVVLQAIAAATCHIKSAMAVQIAWRRKSCDNPMKRLVALTLVLNLAYVIF